MRPLPISQARNPVNFLPFLHFGLYHPSESTTASIVDGALPSSRLLTNTKADFLDLEARGRGGR